jgi:formate dehydrogenase subunit beta
MKTGDLYLGVSTDRRLAERGENGGVVTALLRFALQEKLVDGVFAVQRGANRYEGVPVYLTDPEEVERCAGSLHFATPSIAKSVKKYLETPHNRVAVVCKSCDARALVELAKINQINIDNVLMIGLNCSGTLAPVRHIEMLEGLGIDPYLLEWEDIEADNLILKFRDGSERTFSLDELERVGLGRRSNCRRCEVPIPRMADLACGKWGLEPAERDGTVVEVCSDQGRTFLEKASAAKVIELRDLTTKQIDRRHGEEREKIESALARQGEDFASPEEKFYWFSQLDKCIKCYGCRDVCPLCHCKRCVLERDVPETVTKGVVPPPFTFGAIRLLHVAAYCVNCGQCEDVCSVDIPLSKLAHNLSKVTSSLFHYRAGEDRKAPLPYADISEEEKRSQSPDLQYDEAVGRRSP